jgi:hypothetical protein
MARSRAFRPMNSTTVIIVIIVAVVVLAAIAAAVYIVGARRRSDRLQQRFGPEYEHHLAETEDRRKTEQQLVEREKRYKTLELRTLDAGERAGFEKRWTEVQGKFVDDPNQAVQRADALVVDVMSARGYPVDGFEQQAADISVEHPAVVHHYREAQRISNRNARGEVDTEELRRAVTSYRSLIEALLDDGPSDSARRAGSGSDRRHPTTNEETQV